MSNIEEKNMFLERLNFEEREDLALKFVKSFIGKSDFKEHFGTDMPTEKNFMGKWLLYERQRLGKKVLTLELTECWNEENHPYRIYLYDFNCETNFKNPNIFRKEDKWRKCMYETFGEEYKEEYDKYSREVFEKNLSGDLINMEE